MKKYRIKVEIEIEVNACNKAEAMEYFNEYYDNYSLNSGDIINDHLTITCIED